MASYKILNQGGGAIIRLLNPHLRQYNHVSVHNPGDSDFLYETFPTTTSTLELKIPLDDLTAGYDSNGVYGVIIELLNGNTGVLTYEEF